MELIEQVAYSWIYQGYVRRYPWTMESCSKTSTAEQASLLARIAIMFGKSINCGSGEVGMVAPDENPHNKMSLFH